jgi:hypothetical protein
MPTHRAKWPFLESAAENVAAKAAAITKDRDRDSLGTGQISVSSGFAGPSEIQFQLKHPVSERA